MLLIRYGLYPIYSAMYLYCSTLYLESVVSRYLLIFCTPALQVGRTTILDVAAINYREGAWTTLSQNSILHTRVYTGKVGNFG